MRTEAEKLARKAKYRTDRGLPPDTKLKMGPQRVDLSGKRFGRLILVWPDGCTPKDTLWFCVCDCGTMRHVMQGNMTRNSRRRTVSCGCWAKEKDITHGACVGGKSPSYLAYIRAKLRCTNTKADNYKYYGGAKEFPVQFLFISFPEWDEDLGPWPGRGYSPDRINPWKHYQKGNVRWATKLEQARNKRRNHVKPQTV